VDLSGFAAALEGLNFVDSGPKELVARHVLANDTCEDGTAVDADAACKAVAL
jgi:hypothetical protein